MLQKWKK